MSNAQRGVERAIRLVPPGDRARWQVEWRGDLEAVRGQGAAAADEVARGARRIAWRLRRRQVESIFTGGNGAPLGLAAWALVAGAAAAAFLLGGPVLGAFLILVVVLAAVFALAGSPSHWSHWLMVMSTMVWLLCSGFIWWALGARIDADDAMTTEPALVGLAGPALLVGFIAFIGMSAAVVVALVRGRRR